MVTGGVEHHPDEFDEPAEGGGVTSHGALTGRDAVDQHPTSSVTGLDTALSGKADISHGHAPTPLIHQGTAGWRCTSVVNGSSTLPTANRVFYLPFVIDAACTLDRLGISHVSTTASSQTVRLGIYNVGTDGGPGSRLLDAGTVDLSTTAAFKPLTISQALSVGRYYLAFISTTTTPSFTQGYPLFGASTSATPPNATGICLYETGSGNTLPTTAAITGWATAAPVIWARSA